MYFNSQPHEEADGLEIVSDTSAFYISTHSLTKRLTRQLRRRLLLFLHFNSQPHEEADGSKESEPCDGWIFQLTASRRGWQFSMLYSKPLIFISTHSLTKRLTEEATKILQMVAFQLTASRRGWHKKSQSNKKLLTFQLTASRRGWLRTRTSRSWPTTYFNSQPHEEADDFLSLWYLVRNISTHSLTKRLTSGRAIRPRVALFISTHSLTKRLTKWHSHISTASIFQLTASRRGWRHVWKQDPGK